MKKILLIDLVFFIALLMFQTFPITIGSMDTWYSTTPIPTPHYDHCSVVHDNKIYLVGGSAIDGEPGHARAHVYYASVQPDGYIDAAGWTLTTSLPDARNFGQNNVLVYKDRIYVLGGRANYPPQRIERDTVWFASFNPDGTIGNWNTTTSLPYPVGDIAAVVWNDRIYILGGWDGYGWHNYVYYAEISSDGSLGSWQQSAALPAGAPRIHEHVAVVHNGILYLIGGQYPLNQYPKEVYYATIEASGEVATWTETTHLPVKMIHHSALVYGDDIFVIGGSFESLYRDAVYKAHINSNGSLGSWLEWGRLPQPLAEHSSVVLNGRAYVIGGRVRDHGFLDTVYFASMSAEPGILAYVNIDPDTLNLKTENQWITAYIELPEPNDVAEIDLETIMLNTTIPAVTDPKYGFVTDPEEYITDNDEDGILERMVKFDRAEVVSFIRSVMEIDGWRFRNVTLTVMGEVAGMLFGGSDVIKVIVGDVNGDCVIDIFDLATVGLAYGSFEGEPIYNWYADVNEDSIVDIYDISIVCMNYGESW